VKKVARVFKSFEEADAADFTYWLKRWLSGSPRSRHSGYSDMELPQDWSEFLSLLVAQKVRFLLIGVTRWRHTERPGSPAISTCGWSRENETLNG